MGLISSMSNAVSGLRINQDSIDILSRNVANAGTPGYHRQSLNVIDYNSQNGTYARSEGVNRAFNQSLQAYYNRQVADTALSNTVGTYLNKLQGYLGKPGAAGSLDSMFGTVKNTLQALATSPDDYSTRAKVVSETQALAQRLNQLSNVVQGLRQEAETQIANDVSNLNGMLVSLQEVNARMLDLGMTDTAQAALHDQRDRLVAGIGELIDVQANYRPDGTVALMTRSGVGLLDQGISTFKFTSAGALSPTSQPGTGQVGKLTLTTPSGLTIDLVQQGVLQAGELAGLVTLRDKTLVEVQNQLDEVAAGLALAMSTVRTEGAAATDGVGGNGLKVDLSGMQPGNDVLLTYTENGATKNVRIINSTKPDDYVDSTGQRVIAVDLSSPNAGAELDAKFPGLNISISGGTLQVLDDGAAGTLDVTGLTARSTATAMQTGAMAMPLFVDQGNSPFTGSRDTDPPQIVGFAARISVNPALLADNRLLVQHQLGQTLGDADRPNYLLDQLERMSFVSGGSPAANAGRVQLSGTVGELISQVLNFQGTNINAALSQADSRKLTLETINTQMQTDYGVNIDEEMARLMELQNAYAANARIVSVVKELLDTLFSST